MEISDSTMVIVLIALIGIIVLVKAIKKIIKVALIVGILVIASQLTEAATITTWKNGEINYENSKEEDKFILQSDGVKEHSIGIGRGSRYLLL